MKSRRVGRLVLVALGLCLVVGVLGALANGGKSSSSSSATVAPAATAAPSAGLGLPLADWERAHGKGRDNAGFLDYEGGKWSVFQVSEQGICHLERLYGTAQPALEAARAELGKMLPGDATKVRTYSPDGRPEAVVDLYASAWLGGRFDEAAFVNGERGQFSVLYKVFDGKVSRAVAACGNNP